jgi:hypothetical protein
MPIRVCTMGLGLLSRRLRKPCAILRHYVHPKEYM